MSMDAEHEAARSGRRKAWVTNKAHTYSPSSRKPAAESRMSMDPEQEYPGTNQTFRRKRVHGARAQFAINSVEKKFDTKDIVL